MTNRPEDQNDNSSEDIGAESADDINPSAMPPAPPSPPQKKKKGFLRSAFTGAVVMGAISCTAKAIAGCAALPGIGGVLLAAVASGLAVTGYEMIKDYRKAKPTLDADTKFRQFVGRQWKHYLKRFAFSTGFSAIGAGLFAGAEHLLSTTSFGESFRTMFCSVSDKVTACLNGGGDVSSVSDVDCLPETTTVAEPQTVEPQTDTTVTDALPVPCDDSVAEMIAALECQDLCPQAQEIYEGLLAGEPWAMESAGIGSLNGVYGMPEIPTDAAIDLISQAAEQGNVNAQIDMAYFQYHGLHGVELNREQALETINCLGRSWVGGEALLDKAGETVSKAVAQSSYETLQTSAAETVTAAGSSFEIVGSCDITSPQEAFCTVAQPQIGPGQAMTFTVSDGSIYEFGLDQNAATRPASDFQAEKLVAAINLYYGR